MFADGTWQARLTANTANDGDPSWQPLPYGTQLSIKAPSSVRAGTKAKITGTLSSTPIGTVCTSLQQVTLTKGSATIGPKTTDASGAYRFRTKITKKTKVQVTYGGTAACNPSTSVKKTIKVT